jgi:predicted Holliday junction resolvase-like endonuclease
MEEEVKIPNNYKHITIILVIIIIILSTILFFNKKTIEDMRIEKLNTAKEYYNVMVKKRDKYKELVDMYEERIREAEKCIEANSHS